MVKDEFKPGFFKALQVLRDYLPQIVIGGGWVPFIYYHYLLADKSMTPMHTKDIDLLVADSVPVVGGETIDQLLKDAGLSENFRSLHNPPITCYEGQIEGAEVEIEFLTQQRGVGQSAALEVQAGLNAQALRYISILLENPIEVEIDDLLLAPGRPLSVRVPMPGAFIFHKGLVFPRRAENQKRAKDLYYIFDILANCPKLHDRIVAELSMLKGMYPKKWFNAFKANLADYFASVSSDGVELVATQRPADAFPNMDDDQFRQYVLGILQELLLSI